MNFQATEEQIEIMDAFEHDLDIVIQALAGSGKTSTIRLLGGVKPDKHGLYLAFNKAIAEEARQTFPHNFQCATSHSIAFRAVGRKYEHRLNGPRVTSKDVAEHLGIRKWFKVIAMTGKPKDLSPCKVASLATEMVRRFCFSDDDEISPGHAPFQHGVANMDELRSTLFPYALRIWEDALDENGTLGYKHDYYYKIWALSRPQLSCDFLCVDEFQDTSSVLAKVLADQRNKQIVSCGDSRQQLYEWRGAIDALETMQADEYLTLTKSFRFGPEIAEEANRWLSYLESDLRIVGNEAVDSSIGPIELPSAVICRTNADVVDQALFAQKKGVRVAIAGGTNDIIRLAEGALQLQRDGKSSHPDLSVFSSWSDVLSYVEEEKPDGSFGTFVRLVNRYGSEKVIGIAKNCVLETDAERIVCTGHRSKGLQFDTVALDGAIAPEEMSDKSALPSELRIAYVAATRARFKLDTTAIDGFHQRRKRLAEAAEKRAAAKESAQPELSSK